MRVWRFHWLAAELAASLFVFRVDLSQPRFVLAFCATRGGKTKTRRGTGDFFQALKVPFDLRLVSHTNQGFRQDFFQLPTRFLQSVVRPFSITPGFHQAHFSQIGQMA
jgi:hypothetical protein